MLILGCGNPDRSDDAAGLLVVRKLRKLGIEAREHPGDALALIEAWSGAKDVVVIDTTVSGGTSGRIRCWDGGQVHFAAGEFRCSSHALGVADAVELARALDRLPAKLTIYGIEGKRFDRGGPPSLEVIEAADRLAEEIARKSAPSRSRFCVQYGTDTVKTHPAA